MKHWKVPPWRLTPAGDAFPFIVHVLAAIKVPRLPGELVARRAAIAAKMFSAFPASSAVSFFCGEIPKAFRWR